MTLLRVTFHKTIMPEFVMERHCLVAAPPRCATCLGPGAGRVIDAERLWRSPGIANLNGGPFPGGSEVCLTFSRWSSIGRTSRCAHGRRESGIPERNSGHADSEGRGPRADSRLRDRATDSADF